MEEATIVTKNLTKRYGDFTAVDNLTLEIGRGEVFGLLGPNGAGKSTTILMLMGMTEPSEGIVRVCGLDPVRQPIEVKRHVGYLPEDVGFYDDLSGLENLIYTARLNGLSEEEARKRSLHLLERVGLLEEANKKAGKYSRGMRQRLGLADVLLRNPEVIILDEPTLASTLRYPGFPADDRYPESQGGHHGTLLFTQSAPGTTGLRPRRNLCKRPSSGTGRHRLTHSPTLSRKHDGERVWPGRYLSTLFRRRYTQ